MKEFNLQVKSFARSFSAIAQSIPGKTFFLATLFLLIFPTAVHAQILLTEALPPLQMMIGLIGGGLGIWGIINLIEGYGNDNPGAKSQGIKQLMAGIAMVFVAIVISDVLEAIFDDFV